MDEFLANRHQLKESQWARFRKENPAAPGYKASPDNYGSFFGPSETVIANSVIIKIKSLSDKPKSVLEKLGRGEKLFGNGSKTLKTLIEKKETQKKVQWLRKVRDYSFLSSGSDEVPEPEKKPKTVSRPENPQAKKKEVKIPRPKKEEEFSRNVVSKKPVQSIKPENRAGKKEIQVSRDLKKTLDQSGQKKRGFERVEEPWMKELRSVTGYNPAKYHDDKDDLRMVSGYGDIEKEERRSAKIAKKEDAEELRKLQEANSKKLKK